MHPHALPFVFNRHQKRWCFLHNIHIFRQVDLVYEYSRVFEYVWSNKYITQLCRKTMQLTAKKYCCNSMCRCCKTQHRYLYGYICIHLSRVKMKLLQQQSHLPFIPWDTSVTQLPTPCYYIHTVLFCFNTVTYLRIYVEWTKAFHKWYYLLVIVVKSGNLYANNMFISTQQHVQRYSAMELRYTLGIIIPPNNLTVRSEQTWQLVAGIPFQTMCFSFELRILWNRLKWNVAYSDPRWLATINMLLENGTMIISYGVWQIS